MINEKTPLETWQDLKANNLAVLIDVRTPMEWKQIGYPDLSSIHKQTVKVTILNQFGEVNAHFMEELVQSGLKPEQILYFICRSGKRSMLAADIAQHAGFNHVVNVKDGFEGPADVNGKTGNIAGWSAEKLPAIQPK